jgi:hypothetical protein
MVTFIFCTNINTGKNQWYLLFPAMPLCFRAALHFYPSGAELKILPLLLPNNKAIYSTINGTKIQDGSIIGSWNMQG